ncbi:hypothetical protein BA897_05905 [Spiribacter roseus]|nr:hypothetical protein BA897_05905 [Spiribacter roseus]
MTLIEIVITLALIALGAAAISSLLVGGLNINETNRGFAADVRQATSCYETILAIHETEGWATTDDGEPEPYESCSDNWQSITDSSTLDGWSPNDDIGALLRSGCPVAEQSPFTLECRNVEVDDEPATQFRFTVRGERTISVVLPMRDSSEEDGDGDGDGNGEQEDQGGEEGDGDGDADGDNGNGRGPPENPGQGRGPR